MTDLVSLMKQGDIAALDHLAREAGPRLMAVALRCCRSKDDAGDAVQDAFLRARASMTTFRGEGSPVAWLATLIARSCFRMNRSPHADPARTTHDSPSGGPMRPVPERCGCDDPHEQASRRQLGEALGEGLMALSRTDRLAFLLSADGWSTDEIAAHFGLSGDAVRSRLKRARKILRRFVTRDDLAAAPQREVTT